jgi:putative membrane protein
VLVRELLSRTSPLRGSRWLAPLTVCACLAFSAVFEMLEWLAAVVGGHSADAFLATQGDVWDTQWDMFCALIGATVSVLVLSRLHDRQLDALGVSDSYAAAASTSAPRTSTGRTTRRPR